MRAGMRRTAPDTQAALEPSWENHGPDARTLEPRPIPRSDLCTVAGERPSGSVGDPGSLMLIPGAAAEADHEDSKRSLLGTRSFIRPSKKGDP